MCKFCKDFNRGSGEGVTSLGTTNISMGVFGENQIELEMEIHENGGTITAWLTFDEGNENLSVSCNIKFCPFCGRELKEMED